MYSGGSPGRGSIAMWGAPASGKTTFLAALSKALPEREPGWRLVGEDRASAESLVRLETLLEERKDFPAATGDVERYRWSLVGPVRRARRWFGRGPRGEEVRIGLDLIDAPGGMVTAADSFGPGETLIRGLSASSGIVFLYDPVREYDRGDSFSYAYSALSQLSQGTSRTGASLPHYVAVCITKFDEPRVFSTARRLGMVTFDPEPPMFPRVPDPDAERFFAEISRVSRSDEGSLLPRLLKSTFLPERVRFFVTSAIGFYIDPVTGVFNPGDFQNFVPGAGDVTIRGRVHPINVAEPLLWLTERIAVDRGPQGRNGHAETG